MFDAYARRAGRCLAVCAVAASAAAAEPEESATEHETIPAGPSVTLDVALGRAMARNPALVAFGYQVEAVQGRLQQAGIRPNPELDVTVSDALGSGGFRGMRSAETTVSIAWAIERGVRQRQVEAARANVALAELDARILRLDTAAETARRFIACLAFQERLGLAAEQIRLAQQTIAAVELRVRAGRAMQAALARARAGLVRAELLQEDHRHELLAARHRLSAQWGEREPDFVAVAGNLRTLPVPEPVESLVDRVKQNPNLARFMSRERIAEAELRVARARSRPDWEVHAGVRRFEVTDDLALVAGLSIPIGVRERYQGRIAEARAAMSRAAGEGRAARVEIESAVFALYQQLRHHIEVAVAIRDRLIPQLERALADVERAYELGRTTFVELTGVQAELLGARHDYLESSIGAHETLVEIERLTGETILPSRRTGRESS